MKNVFFALAFLLVGTFAFANNNLEATSENVENLVSIDDAIFNDFNFKSLNIDLLSFTSSDEIVNDLTSMNISQADNIEVEVFDYWVRYCIYRNGRKYCTEWEYVIELDEVVIYG